MLNHNRRSRSSNYDDDSNEEEDIGCESVKGVSTPDEDGSIEIEENIEEMAQTQTQNQSSPSLVNNDNRYKEGNNDIRIPDAFTALTPSHSEMIKGFQLSSKGPIHKIIEEQYNSLVSNE